MRSDIGCTIPLHSRDGRHAALPNASGRHTIRMNLPKMSARPADAGAPPRASARFADVTVNYVVDIRSRAIVNALVIAEADRSRLKVASIADQRPVG